MIIGDVTLVDFKKLLKTEQVFVFEDKKVVEMYIFKPGPFVLRTVVAKSKNREDMMGFWNYLPENRVHLISRTLGNEFDKTHTKKMDEIIRLLREKDGG